MQRLKSLRRLALGAAITGAAIGAVPAVASAAASSCTYDPNGIGKVTVQDNSGVQPLRVSVVGTIIAINDAESPQILCLGGGTFATTTNTNQIRINSTITGNVDGYIVDQSEGVLAPGRSAEVDGTSELETVVSNTGALGDLYVVGTPGSDSIRVGRLGDVNFGADGDVDVSVSNGTRSVEVKGGAGNDFLTGQGNGNAVGPATVPLGLHGDDGFDSIIGGNAKDILDGGEKRDIFESRDHNQIDRLFGGSGVDEAFIDQFDSVVSSIEGVHRGEPVGQLKLAPRVLKAEAGMISRLKMSWKHPQSWRELRKLELRLYDGKQEVGMINARPAGGRLSENGLVDLMAGSKLGHHGKWVTAKLALDVPKSLAGKDLRVDVTATDTDGRKQLVRAAGTIRVAE
jgi:hypothetical protein